MTQESGGQHREPTTEIHQMRQRMVAELADRGIADRRILQAMASVRRDHFVDDELVESAYDDRPLDIGRGQTISQPYVVAAMALAAEIQPGNRVLEVGTGSGYGAAVLASLGAEVWTIERHQDLADRARSHLEAEGFTNVRVLVGDGSQGLAAEAPFDAIVVTACPAVIPPALPAQLADGGRLVIPVGPQRGTQTLVRLRRHGDRFERDELGAVRFVPLIVDRPA